MDKARAFFFVCVGLSTLSLRAAAILFLAILTPVLRPIPTLADEPLFGARTDYATGDEPLSVAIGDLNGDSMPDLATSNSEDGTVSVLLGNGDGTFSPRSDQDSGDSCPQSVVIGDVDRNGSLDIVTANYYCTVSMLLADGFGGFSTACTYAIAGQSTCAAIGYVDCDSTLDLVTANYEGSWQGSRVATVSILRGNGDGTFQPRTDLEDWGDSHSVAMGDLNGDSKSDLVVANSGANTVSVLLGNGDGTFGARTDFATGSAPIDAAIRDLNGDNKPDLVVANAFSNTVSVLLGNGNGTFGARTDFGTGSAPYSLAMGDLNGDGKPDVATANMGADAVSVLVGNGDGTFGARTDFASGNAPFSVAIGDLNGDRKPDVATANMGANTVSVLLNTSTASVEPGQLGDALALGPVRPNPSLGCALTVPFSLPTAAPARLELLDVAGRRIASHDVDAGQHTLDLGAGQHLAPGLYLVRLTQGSDRRTTRVAVICHRSGYR